MPTAPFAAAVEVQDASGAHVETVRSDETGRFRIELEPGTYSLVPDVSASGAPPTAPPQTVTVASGQDATVHIRYDSGIR